MSDVLERIVSYVRNTPVPTQEALDLLDAAADEIELLRDRLRSVLVDMTSLHDEYVRLMHRLDQDE